MRRNTPEDFWARVVIAGADQCWPWVGCREKKSGYGRVRFAALGYDRQLNAHQVAWALANNCSVNKGRENPLHHTCGNRLCCNPHHIVLLGLVEHAHLHMGRGCQVHGYDFWVTRPSGQQACAECNRARCKARHTKVVAARISPKTGIDCTPDGM